MSKWGEIFAFGAIGGAGAWAALQYYFAPFHGQVVKRRVAFDATSPTRDSWKSHSYTFRLTRGVQQESIVLRDLQDGVNHTGKPICACCLSSDDILSPTLKRV